MPTSSTVLLRRFTTKAKFRHMEVILRVAELGSMRRAAEAIGMTQPSVSQLVSDMENMLETSLFFRHARGVAPTEATLELLPVARRILDALGDGSEIFASRLDRQRSVLRVSASEAGMLGLIYPILPEFVRRNRNLQVILRAVVGNDPLAPITQDTCDILCAGRPTVIPNGWIFESCLEDSLVTVCAPHHPLAGQSNVTYAMLRGERWLMNRVDSLARRCFERVFEEENWTDAARCNVVTHSLEITQKMLDEGGYLALVPRSVVRPYQQQGTIAVLDGALTAPLMPLGFVRKAEDENKAVSLFAGHLRKLAAQPV